MYYAVHDRSEPHVAHTYRDNVCAQVPHNHADNESLLKATARPPPLTVAVATIVRAIML